MAAGRCGMFLFLMIAILFINFHKISASENETDLFTEEYHKWERLYRAVNWAPIVETMLNAAEKKFLDIARYDTNFNDSVKYPVIVVSLYTQNRIYQTVNFQLMTYYPKEIWQIFTNLLSKAIDILSPLVNKHCQRYTVYRGQGCHPIPDVEQTFTFGRFLSTTFNPRVAFIYSKSSKYVTDCSTVIKIENATGLPVSMFAAYATEEEVIIKTDAVMYVKAKFNNTEKNNDTVMDIINIEVQNLLNESNAHGFKYPDILVYLEMEYTRNLHNGTTKEMDMDKIIGKRSLDDYATATNLDMDALLNEEDSWKEHLKAEYDGKDSHGVPPCIEVS